MLCGNSFQTNLLKLPFDTDYKQMKKNERWVRVRPLSHAGSNTGGGASDVGAIASDEQRAAAIGLAAFALPVLVERCLQMFREYLTEESAAKPSADRTAQVSLMLTELSKLNVHPSLSAALLSSQAGSVAVEGGVTQDLVQTSPSSFVHDRGGVSMDSEAEMYAAPPAYPTPPVSGGREPTAASLQNNIPVPVSTAKNSTTATSSTATRRTGFTPLDFTTGNAANYGTKGHLLKLFPVFCDFISVRDEGLKQQLKTILHLTAKELRLE